MRILSIDPGANTGIAEFDAGVLKRLSTVTPHEVLNMILPTLCDVVVFEDSTLISNIYTAPSIKGAAKLKIARNIGEIDGYCKLIKAVCGSRGIAFHQISPKAKGAKLDAQTFNDLTGWTGKSNQHERDAAMCAWVYRSVAKQLTKERL